MTMPVPAERPHAGPGGDAMVRAMGLALEQAAGVLSELILLTVEPGPIQAAEVPWAALAAEYPGPVVVAKGRFRSGLPGAFAALAGPSGAGLIAALMLGEPAPEGDTPGELHLAAMAEAARQMAGVAADALSGALGRPVEMAPPDVAWEGSMEDPGSLLPGVPADATVVAVRSSLRVHQEGAPGEVAFTVVFAPQLVRELEEAALASQAPAAGTLAKETPVAEPIPERGAPPAQETPQRSEAQPQDDRIPFELLRRVSVPVTVRLGQARLSLQEVLGLTRGAIVPLDAVEGEPVDVLVSGTLVARGEVVVVREHFGVRITELMKPEVPPGV